MARIRDVKLVRKFRLLICIICVVNIANVRPKSLNGTQRKINTSEALETTRSPNREIINFVDGKCPPHLNSSFSIMNQTSCQTLCKVDVECTGDKKCCQRGCSFICVEPWFPEQVVDWEQETQSLNEISRDLEQYKTGLPLREPCSTSILDGMEPLKCPSNKYCFITMEEDKQSRIPNRGECIRKNHPREEKLKSILIDERKDRRLHNKACLHKGKRQKHRSKFQRKCRECVCYDGVVFCENKRCPGNQGVSSPTRVTSQSGPRSLKLHAPKEDQHGITIGSVASGDKEEPSGSGDTTGGSTRIDEEPDAADDEEQSGSGDTTAVDKELKAGNTKESSGSGITDKQGGGSPGKDKDTEETEDKEEQPETDDLHVVGGPGCGVKEQCMQGRFKFGKKQDKQVNETGTTGSSNNETEQIGTEEQKHLLNTTDFSFKKKSNHTHCPLCKARNKSFNQTTNRSVTKVQKIPKTTTKPGEKKIILEKQKQIERRQENTPKEKDLRAEEFSHNGGSYVSGVVTLKAFPSGQDDTETSVDENDDDDSGSSQRESTSSGDRIMSLNENSGENVLTIESSGDAAAVINQPNKDILTTIELQRWDPREGSDDEEESGSGYIEAGKRDESFGDVQRTSSGLNSGSLFEKGRQYPNKTLEYLETTDDEDS